MEHFLKKGTYELKLFVHHLAVDSIRSVPNPSVWHFNQYLMFQEHWFYKKPDLATLILYNKNNFSTMEKEHLKKL